MSQGGKEICLAAQITGRELSPFTPVPLLCALYPAASPGMKLFTPIPVAVTPLGVPGHGDRPGKLQCGTQGCSCPCAVAAALAVPAFAVLSFPLASPAAPEAKHNTASSACCFLHPAQAALLLHRSSWRGSLLGFTPPAQLQGVPTPPGWGSFGAGCSPGCCCGQPHTPVVAAFWDKSWPQAQIPQPVIAKGSAGTSSASPGGCSSSGAGVRRPTGMQGQHSPLLAC